jgi:hypothetical protein
MEAAVSSKDILEEIRALEEYLADQSLWAETEDLGDTGYKVRWQKNRMGFVIEGVKAEDAPRVKEALEQLLRENFKREG